MSKSILNTSPSLILQTTPNLLEADEFDANTGCVRSQLSDNDLLGSWSSLGSYDNLLAVEYPSECFWQYHATSMLTVRIGSLAYEPTNHLLAEPTVPNSSPLSAPASATSLTNLASYLERGYWEDDGRSMPPRFILAANDDKLYYNVTGWSGTKHTRSGDHSDSNGISSARQELVREAFKIYEEVLGIDFIETTSDEGHVDFFFMDGDVDRAFASDRPMYVGGLPVWTRYAVINLGADFDSGYSNIGGASGYMFQAVLHEIGHALGLGHQGDYNAEADFDDDAKWMNDSWTQSMMSYFSQTANTWFDTDDFAHLISPMAADFMALDAIYSPQGFGISHAFSGNTIYGVGTNITDSVSLPYADLATLADTNAFTIVDGGGIDLIDFSNFGVDQVIDLGLSSASSTHATYSSVGGLVNNMSLAVGTVIENASGGSGDDVIRGNDHGNVLNGNSGTDELHGYGGADSLYGGSDADRLYGGEGNDYLSGYTYNDELYGNDGNDRLYGGNGSDLLSGQSGADKLYGGDSDDRVYGGAGDDFVVGGSGKAGDDEASGNLLNGGSGNDILIGGDNADNLYGSFDNDNLLGNGGDDYLSGGTGTDEASYRFATGSVMVDLASGTATGADGNDQLVSIENILGSEYSDSLTGDENANAISGGGGGDVIDGGGGDDVLRGGGGNDEIFCGAGSNAVYGDEGNDVIHRGGGDALLDSYYGGTGSDTINTGGVQYSNRVLFDMAAGYMLVNGSNYEVWNGFENFDGSAGSGEEGVTGTSSSNEIRMGSGANAVFAGEGSDSVYGGLGNDIIHGGGGGDIVEGGEGSDTLYGAEGVDKIYGGLGDDSFVYLAPNEGADFVGDFSSSSTGNNDTFQFLGRAFGRLSAGALALQNFQSAKNDRALTPDARFLYETDTGILRFDDDGSGAHVAVVIASLKVGVLLTISDFLII